MPDKNLSKPNGPAVLFLDGGTVVLDGMYFKRVIIRNAKVVYRGGPVHMEDVYFVNCTFTWEPTQKNTLLFARSVFSPDSATTFSAE